MPTSPSCSSASSPPTSSGRRPDPTETPVTTTRKLPLLWVRLLSDHFRIMVEVWDNLPPAIGTPVVRHPGPDEESGRGLEMIDALSEDWGWESVPGWKGKRVWAVLLAPQYQD